MFIAFSNEEKAVVKNLSQFKEYSSWRMLAFLKINSKTEELRTQLKDLGYNKHQPKKTQKHESGRIKYVLAK